jgi:hypothetical protein
LTHERAARITIIMPLFNKAAEVRRAIASVQRQTLPEWRLLVVDDGSTDAGPAIVRAISDPRIELRQQRNQGVSAARNAALGLATTPLVAFLDADDEWDDGMLEALLLLQRDFPTARTFATAYRLRGPGGGSRVARLHGLPADFRRGLLHDYFKIASRSDPPLWTSAVAVERRLLQDLGGFPVGVAAGEDLLTWARLAAQAPVAYLREPKATFWEPHGTDPRPRRRPAEPDVVGAELRKLHAPGLRRYRAHWHRMRGVWYLGLGQLPAARRELRRAVGLGPGSPALWALAVLAHCPGGIATRTYRRFKARQSGPSGSVATPG